MDDFSSDVAVDTVEQFKARVKELIKQCRFKEAITLCNTKYDSEVFQDL